MNLIKKTVAIILMGTSMTVPSLFAAPDEAEIRRQAEENTAAAFAELAAEFKKSGGYEKVAKGDPEAQCELAFLYQTGFGLPRDSAKALELYQKAAAQGFATAEFHLAGMYLEGDGVPEDGVKAWELNVSAAAKGCQGAKEFLARIDKHKPWNQGGQALRFRAAAEKGDAQAQHQLGQMYLDGRGVPQNKPEAIKWFEKAVKSGNVEAKAALDRMGAKK